MTCRNRFRPVRHDWGSEATEGVTDRSDASRSPVGSGARQGTDDRRRETWLFGWHPTAGWIQLQLGSSQLLHSGYGRGLGGGVLAPWVPLAAPWLLHLSDRCYRVGPLRSVSDDGTWLGASPWLRGAKYASPHPHHPSYPKLKRPRGTRSETRYRLGLKWA